MRKRVIISLSFLLLAMHVLSHAGNSITEEKYFEPLRGKSLEDSSLSKSDSLLLLLKNEEDRRKAWSLTVGGSFVGDEAGDQSTADLNTTAKITKGEFPRQFRFMVESKIWLKDDELGDEVTEFLLNYDYYVRPSWEIYAFVERFSDSYMDIKRRFEIGFGVMYERTWGWVDREDTVLIDRLPPPPALTSEQKTAFEKYRTKALTSMEKREARLTGGIAVSFLDELEQAEIEGKDITLTSEKRFRFVVRPSIRWRVTKELEIKGHCYWKLPVSKLRENNGNFDYRVDAQFLAELELSEDKHGNERVSLQVRYDVRFDNAPPFVEQNGEEFTARRSHGRATLGISVKI